MVIDIRGITVRLLYDGRFVKAILDSKKIKEIEDNYKDPELTIAKMVGYKNLSTFTEAFKRFMGLLPSEYRNKYIQG